MRVHSIRMFSTWEPSSTGGWHQVAKPLHAWADFDASAAGSVEVWNTAPRAGTYAGTDAYGLLWSGRPVVDDADRADLPLPSTCRV